MDVYLNEISNANIEALMASIGKGEEPPAYKPPVQAEQEEIKPPPVNEEKPVVREEKPVVTETRTVGTGSSGIPDRQRLPVQDGIYYRVQLAAGSWFTDADKTFAANNLTRPVLVERHNGLYKYTVGSFSNYDQANEFRKTVVSRGVSGAFVVAYRNGKRINVIDARKATGG
jgi:N-acetylmuramoyl-L-alanine amidase